jgi:hypothetical protein
MFRLTKWLCSEVEFIDRVFTGVLAQCNFGANLSSRGQVELGRARNRYERNDFSGATLKGIAFMGGVDLLDQKLPHGGGYIFLEEAESAIVAGLARVDAWEDSPEKKEARFALEFRYESYVARGQRQILLSPHDFVSKDGVKERAFARLSEVLHAVLADQAAGVMSPDAPEVARLEIMRRARLGHRFVYFRTTDTEDAKRVLEYPDGPHGTVGFDVVDAPGIDAFATLGELVALIGGTRWGIGSVPYVSVWPPVADEPESIEEFNALPADSPWRSSPHSLQELGVAVRDTLAALEDDRLTDIAVDWARTPSLAQYSDSTPTAIGALVADLVALARRARDADSWLYCWFPSR